MPARALRPPAPQGAGDAWVPTAATDVLPAYALAKRAPLLPRDVGSVTTGTTCHADCAEPGTRPCARTCSSHSAGERAPLLVTVPTNSTPSCSDVAQTVSHTTSSACGKRSLESVISRREPSRGKLGVTIRQPRAQTSSVTAVHTPWRSRTSTRQHTLTRGARRRSSTTIPAP